MTDLGFRSAAIFQHSGASWNNFKKSPNPSAVMKVFLELVAIYFSPTDSKLVSHLKSSPGFTCSFHSGSMSQSKGSAYQGGFGCSLRVTGISVRARAFIQVHLRCLARPHD